jgi:hypothetical protein
MMLPKSVIIYNYYKLITFVYAGIADIKITITFVSYERTNKTVYGLQSIECR